MGVFKKIFAGLTVLLLVLASYPLLVTANSQGVIKLSSHDAGAVSSYQFTYTNGMSALEGGKDEINIIFVNPYDTNAPFPQFIDRSLIKVNNISLDNGLVHIEERKVSFRLPSRLTINANSSITITIDQKAEIKHPNQGGQFIALVSNSKNVNAMVYTYDVKGQSSYDLFVIPRYDNERQIREYDFSFKTSESGALNDEKDWISLSLPRTVTRDYFIANFEVYVNNQLTDKNQIQVTGQNVTFPLPHNMKIPAKTEAYIKLRDTNNYLGPSISLQFKLMTSKDSNWVESNKIEPSQRQVTSLPKSPVQEPSAPPATQNPNNQQPNPIEKPQLARKIQLFLNSKDVYLDGMRSAESLLAAPYTTKGRDDNAHTMVPLRFVSENLGAMVNYIPDGGRITITYQNKYMVLSIGSVDIIGSKEKLPVPAETPVDGITFVPLRFISEWMGLQVTWVQDTQSIILEK